MKVLLKPSSIIVKTHGFNRKLASWRDGRKAVLTGETSPGLVDPVQKVGYSHVHSICFGLIRSNPDIEKLLAQEYKLKPRHMIIIRALADLSIFDNKGKLITDHSTVEIWFEKSLLLGKLNAKSLKSDVPFLEHLAQKELIKYTEDNGVYSFGLNLTKIGQLIEKRKGINFLNKLFNDFSDEYIRIDNK